MKSAALIALFAVACGPKRADIPAPAGFDGRKIEQDARRAVGKLSNADEIAKNTLDLERHTYEPTWRQAASPLTVTKALEPLRRGGATQRDVAALSEQVRVFADGLRKAFAEHRALIGGLPGDSRAAKLGLVDRAEDEAERKLSELLSLVEGIELGTGDPAALAERAGRIHHLVAGPAPSPTSLHGSLSYVAPVVTSQKPPATSSVSPAASALSGILGAAPLGGLGSDALADDTRLAEEVSVTPAITLEAQRLRGSPARIYDFVKNTLEIDWVYGVRQDAEQTLVNRRGSPWEACALTIALLRASGVPARYVTGTAKLTLAQAMDLARAATEREVYAHLAQSGIPHTFQSDPSTGKPTFLVSHVLVEAFLDYVPSRGVTVGSGLKEWVAFDPSLTGRARNTVTAPA